MARLGDVHGLTCAQRRAVMGLVEGLSPQEIEAAAGTSPGTVRLQIKQVFQRTGLNRQIDLVRHVGALALGGAASTIVGVDDASATRSSHR